MINLHYLLLMQHISINSQHQVHIRMVRAFCHGQRFLRDLKDFSGRGQKEACNCKEGNHAETYKEKVA